MTNIESRILELKEYASDGDGALSAESETDLLYFLRERTFTVRPSITSLDNGNFRALWQNEKGEQIGLQFLGEGQIQFVLFAYLKEQRFMKRMSGRGNFSDVDRLIGLENLWRLK